MMELAEAVIQNPNLFLDPYASALSAPVLTCLMSRKLGGGPAGTGDGADTLRDQYGLRQLAASLLEMIARKYGATNALLRPKLTRTCLKHFLDPTRQTAVLFGAISGVAAAGGSEAVRVLVLPNLKSFDAAVLQPLHEKGAGTAPGEPHAMELEMLVGGIMKAVESLVAGSGMPLANGVNGADLSREGEQVTEFLGPVIGQRVARLGNHALNRAILEVRHLE